MINHEPTSRCAIGPAHKKTIAVRSQLTTVRHAPCGRLLAGGGCDGKIHFWNLDAVGASESLPLSGHNGWVLAVAYDPGGRRLFTADSWGRICCWAYAASKRPVWEIPAAHDGLVRELAVSPDGSVLASCGADRCVRLWTADGGRLKHAIAHDHDVFCLAFHPGGMDLVSGDLKGVIRHWELAGPRRMRELDARRMYLCDRIQDIGGMRRLAFHRSGSPLVCAGCFPKGGGLITGTPAVLTFNWPDGKRLDTCLIGSDTDGFVEDLAWLGDGSLAGVTNGHPGNGRLFLLRPGEASPYFTSAIANGRSISAHPDGIRLVTLSTQAVTPANAKRTMKEASYPDNTALLDMWEMPA